MNNSEILLRLLQIPNLGANSIQRLCETIPPAQLLEYDQTAFAYMGWTAEQIQRWFQPEQRFIQPALEWASQQGNVLIDYFHPDYPYLLKQTDSAPPVLFVKGNIDLLSSPQIAMVGSRYCSAYGEYWAKQFAAQLVNAGFAVTSGLALGIDGHCHLAALEAKGKTIAVLGSGLEKLYPSRHKMLAQRILHEQGALVSEFLPEQPPVSTNFPRRNRIISGLSLATLVIEATEKSGSLITARYALEQNREVFAIPGNIHNEFSQGCHKLIKQGAMLVETIEDILQNLPTFRPALLKEKPVQKDLYQTDKTTTKPTALSALATVEPYHPILFQHIQYQPINADDLATACGLPIEEVLVQLLELELQDLIIPVQGGYQRR